MYDLHNIGNSRMDSATSLSLKAHASDVGLRTTFNGNNGSSLSLGGSSLGLAARSGTSSDKSKAWVNPLDVHFMRSTPTGPPAAHRSPLGTQRVASGAENAGASDDTQKAKESETDGKSAEREQSQTYSPPDETVKGPTEPVAKIEANPLQKVLSNDSANSCISPKSQAKPRPSIRGGTASPNNPHSPVRHAFAHQGPPKHAPPTQSLPSIPHQGPLRQHPPAPLKIGARRQASPSGTGAHLAGLASPGLSRPYSPSPLSPALRINTAVTGSVRPLSPAIINSQTIENNTNSRQSKDSSSQQSPTIAGPAALRSPMGSKPESTQALPVGVDAVSGPSSSEADDPIEQFTRPIFRDGAKRDTLTILSPRRRSLSMKIEKFEKSLVDAQQRQPVTDKDSCKRYSSSSSRYSVASASDDDEPILSPIDIPVIPAPLRTPGLKTNPMYSEETYSETSLAPQPHHHNMHPVLRSTKSDIGRGAESPAPLQKSIYALRHQSPPPGPGSPHMDVRRQQSRTPTPQGSLDGLRQQSSTPGPYSRRAESPGIGLVTSDARCLQNTPPTQPMRRPGPRPPRPSLDEYCVTNVSNGRNTPVSRSVARAPSKESSTSSTQINEFGQDLVDATANNQKPSVTRPTYILDQDLVPSPESATAPDSVLGGPTLTITPTVGSGAFKFDFGPNGAPPTPDSTGWGANEGPGPSAFRRPNAPPPLSFNFSPNAYSREPGPWTPPIAGDGLVVGPAEGPTLRLGTPIPPSPVRPRTPVDAAALGIGIARGPSVRERSHPVDEFGTCLI